MGSESKFSLAVVRMLAVVAGGYMAACMPRALRIKAL
jgi:hypothetical protein